MEQGIDTSARVAGRDYYERCPLHLHRNGRISVGLTCLIAYAIASTLLASRPGLNEEILQVIVAIDAAVMAGVLGYAVGRIQG